MDTKAGLWIDRKKAVIVFIKNDETEKKIIKSGMDTQLGRYDGVKSTASFDDKQRTEDDIRERILSESLKIYFDKVIAEICDAGTVYIFGPGETKTGLLHRLLNNKVRGTVDPVETAGRMTDPQIIAKVKEYYK
jgi:hypothetical protein